MNDEGIIGLIESEVLAFSGVSRFADASLSENIQAAFGRDISNPSIRISEDDGVITISIEIIVYYGVNIPQLCYDIQTKVRNNIRKQTGLDIKAVNIKVEGIDKE